MGKLSVPKTMTERDKKLEKYTALCAALCLWLAPACGVRGAPRPPLAAGETEAAPAPKTLENTAKHDSSAASSDLSEGGRDGVESCEACELHEKALIE